MSKVKYYYKVTYKDGTKEQYTVFEIIEGKLAHMLLLVDGTEKEILKENIIEIKNVGFEPHFID